MKSNISYIYINKNLLTDGQSFVTNRTTMETYANFSHEFEARLDVVWCALLRRSASHIPLHVPRLKINRGNCS